MKIFGVNVVTDIASAPQAGKEIDQLPIPLLAHGMASVSLPIQLAKDSVVRTFDVLVTAKEPTT